jgi:uncharacterized protein (DUF427 family)
VTDPAHTVRVKANLNQVRALFHGHVIADTSHALTVLETGLNPVQYFPREDVVMDLLSKTERHTRCPYKGEASYFTLTKDDQIAENAVWSYEDPIPSVLALKGYLAFYPDKVEILQLGSSDDAVEPHAVHP